MKQYISVTIFILLLLLTPGQSLCGPMPRPGSSPSKTAISFTMGLGSYNMGDINNLIDSDNDIRGRDDTDHINYGTELGFRVTQFLRPNLSVALAFGIHSTKTESSGSYYPYVIDASGQSFDLMIIRTMRPAEKFNFGAGAGIGLFHTTGELGVTTDENGFYSTNFRGYCPMISGFGVGEYLLADDLWVSLETGFRYANVRSTHWPDGSRFEYPDGSDISLSYTGFYVRASIRTFIKLGW